MDNTQDERLGVAAIVMTSGLLFGALLAITDMRTDGVASATTVDASSTPQSLQLASSAHASVTQPLAPGCSSATPRD